MNYKKRRQELRAKIPTGNILILSALWVPRNYPASTYAFHQDATFRYYTGLAKSDCALFIDENGKETLYLTTPDPEDVIWTGSKSGGLEMAAKSEIENVCDYAQLARCFSGETHWLEPYDFQLKLRLCQWLGISVAELSSRASRCLLNAVIDQRSHKDADEVAQLESAIALTRRMLNHAQAAIEPGLLESDILAALVSPAVAKERQQSFLPIVTTHGEIMHNTSYAHELHAGDMVLIDCGAESRDGYCADITRTYPVSGWFSPQQKGIYDAVMAAQCAGIAMTAKEGASQFDVHMAACRALTEALQGMGLMKGDLEASLSFGAHALFMPHGIGHMLGLDAHDMENLGDAVGYAPGTARSSQFGLHALRLHRRLEPGYVVTVEPGCYFIPELIDRWHAERRLEEFICYDQVEKFRNARGIRIEDDVLITLTGSKVLGPGIAK